MGDWTRTLPSAETVAISLFWSSMLDWIPWASAMTAAEQAPDAALPLPALPTGGVVEAAG